MTKMKVGEEKDYFAYPTHCCFSLKEVRAGTLTGKELEARADAEAMEVVAGWLASHGLLSLPPYRTQDHQLSNAITHHGLDTGPIDH